MRGICTWMGKGRSRSQAGFTLLEAVVSVALISTVILALSGGLLASVKSSQAAKATQEIDAVLSTYAETLKAEGMSDCNGPTGIVPVGYTGSKTAESWSGSSWDTCDPNDSAFRLSLVVADAAGDTANGQIVIRK